MFKKQSFDTNIYMRLLRIVYIFLMLNIAFMIAVLPFFICVMVLALDIRNSLLFGVSLLFFGPSFLAVLSVLQKLKENKDVNPFTDFFRALKANYVRGFLYGAISVFGSIFVLGDIFFMTKITNGKWLIPLFIILFIVINGIVINLMYFQMRNPLRTTRDLLMVAAYYGLRKWYVAILNVCLLVGMGILMVVKPQFGFLLTPSILMGIVYLNCTHLQGSEEQQASNFFEKLKNQF